MSEAIDEDARAQAIRVPSSVQMSSVHQNIIC